jgi:hypothetical protein
MGASALAKTGAGLVEAQGMMSEEDKRRLALLKGMRARGDLGLADRQRAGMEAQEVVQRGAALRDMAPMPNPLVATSREVLAASLGQQNAVASARQQAARDINEADRLAAEAQQTEIQALSTQEAEQKAARRAALLGGVVDSADLASKALMADVQKKEELAKAAAELKTKIESEQRIFETLSGGSGSFAPMPGYTGTLPIGAWVANPSPFWK